MRQTQNVTRMRSKITPKLILVFALVISTLQLLAIPADLSKRTVGTPYNQAAGVTFDTQGHMFVWERRGHVYVSDDEVKRANPIINIAEEVGNWGDFGLTGFALDPDFKNNGLVYLLYSVDRHYLRCNELGRCNYDANTNEEKMMTIGRITRYQLDVTNNSIVAGSRTIILGATPEDGFVIDELGHSIGHLQFGLDGSLLVSCGDAASPVGMDAGNNGATYSNQEWNSNDVALDWQILPGDQRVGAFRSQMLSSINGKIIRINPDNGQGMVGNPFYEAGNPGSDRSRVWVLGLRNPYRFTVKPGSADASNNGVGVLYIGDVGWDAHEELNIAEYPGQNFGWPIWEGFENTPPNNGNYLDQNTISQESDDCNGGHFQFEQLIGPDVENELTRYSNKNNGCDNGWTKYFFHTRPAIDFAHPNSQAVTNQARIPVFNNGNPGTQNIGTEAAGGCALAGVFYSSTRYPERFQGQYFHVDYQEKWVRRYGFSAGNDYQSGNGFETGETVVHMTTHPTTGDIYYVDYEGANTVIKHIYNPLVTPVPPVAIAEISQAYGSSGTTVTLDATNSYDPDGDDLTYLWNLPNGTTSNQAVLNYTFNTGQVQNHTIVLTVFDSEEDGTTQVTFSENNTPPVINSISPAPSWQFSMAAPFVDFNLAANVADAEHAANEMTYEWMVTELHNDHNHPVAPRYGQNMTWSVTALGCQEEFGSTFSYEVSLKVTDDAGLWDTITQVHWADCSTMPDDGFTVYFKQKGDWGAPLIHYWGVEPAGAMPASQWPGTAMEFDKEADGFNWYKFTFPDVTMTNLLFHDDANNQTDDVLNVTRNQWYDWPIIYDADPRPIDNTPTVEITSPADGSVSYDTDVTVEFSTDNILAGEHILVSLDGTQTEVLEFPFPASYTFTNLALGNHTFTIQGADASEQAYGNPEANESVTVQVAEEPEGISIYFQRPDANYGDPYIHYWGFAPAAAIPASQWPGTIMDEDGGDNWYVFDMPAVSETNFLIHNNNTGNNINKSEDLGPITADVWVVFDGANWTVLNEDPRQPQPSTVTITAPANQALFTGGAQNINLTYQVQGDASTYDKIAFLLDMGQVSETTTFDGQFTYTNLPIGIHELKVQLRTNEDVVVDEDAVTVDIQDAIEGITIYFQRPDANYGQPKIHYWGIEPAGALPGSAWPGFNMTDLNDDNWFSHPMPGITQTNLLIHNNTGNNINKSDDYFEITQDTWFIFDGTNWTFTNVDPRTPPTPWVEITSPADAAQLSGGIQDIEIDYLYGGDETAFDHIDYFIDGVDQGEFHDFPGTFTFSNVAVGVHEIKVELRNGHEIVVAADSIEIEVLEVPGGQVVINTPAAGSTFDGAPQNVMMMYNVSGNPETYDGIFFFDNGTQVHSANTFGGMYTYFDLGLGSHTLRVELRQGANSIVSSDEVTVEVVEVPEGITIYFQRPDVAYGQPKLHYWGVEPVGAIAGSAWPGTDMTDLEFDNWYAFEMLGVTQTNFLIHNNTGNNINKSEDYFDITEDTWVTFDGANWVLSNVDPFVPTVWITSPADGATVYSQDVTFEYGYANIDATLAGADDHIHFYLDDEPRYAVHDPSGTEVFTDLELGWHTMTLKIANAGHSEFANPEATATIDFLVADEPDGITVYFQKPGGWPTANIHYWGVQPAGAMPGSNWPGYAMDYLGDDWYSYWFPSVTFLNCLFNDGDGNPKTADFTNITADEYFDVNGVTGNRPPTTKASYEVLALEEFNAQSIEWVKQPRAVQINGLGAQDWSLQVFSLTGQLIAQSTVNDRTVVPTSNWTPGVYLIMISDGIHRETYRFAVR